MAKAKPPNPKAFARPIGAIPWRDSPPDYNPDQEGMDLRDYFAAAAITGVLSNPSMIEGLRSRASRGGMTPAERLSEFAFEMADAMLVQRALVSADA